MYHLFKRIFDLSLAIFGIVVLLPFFAVTALVIKLDSQGPVLYRGKRVGRFGKYFRILKFRTMHPNAERLGTTTTMHDSRITKVGGILRQYKLDELPQLFNVVSGQMSIVGPRPEVEEHTNEYDDEERTILDVKPGITDYASIRYASLDRVLGTEDPHQAYVMRVRSQKNRLRIRYVQGQSFSEDLKIIYRTIVVVLHKLRRN